MNPDITMKAFCFRQYLGYARIFIGAMICSRVELAARLLAAESQLTECKRRIKQKQAPKPRFTNSFRLLWVVLSKLWAPWRNAVHLMQPATVVRWRRSAFRTYWRWKSSHGPGRPPISEEMRALIRRLSTENPLWGAGQIRDTLILLGFDVPCEDTIRKYMVKPRRPQDGAASWLAFLHNHVDVSWAMDFFTVATADFRFIYVFVVMHHGRLLKEYIEDYYHIARPHQGLEGDTPLPSNKPMRKDHPTKLVSIPICGGLHHRYERVAA